MPDKTRGVEIKDLWREIVAMGEKVCEECPDVCPGPGSFEDSEKERQEKRDALQAFLQNKDGQDSDDIYDVVWRPDADTVVEYFGDHFTPRDLWPDKIDEALEAAHQAGERGEALDSLDLGLR